MLQYVWLLKSPATLLPEKYGGFSAYWLRWDCRSHWQLRWLVWEKKKISTIILNWYVNDISNWGQIEVQINFKGLYYIMADY